MRLRRGRDFAAVSVPVVYRGCRCPQCLRLPAPPPERSEPVTISQKAVDRVILAAFGRMPDPPE